MFTLENDNPELFNFFNDSVATGLDFWTFSSDLVMEIPELFIAAGGFGAGVGVENERVEFFNLFSFDSAEEETLEGGVLTSGLTSIDLVAVVFLAILILELASNLEGSSAGLADIAREVPDGAGEGAVLRRVLGLGVVEVSSGLGWFPRLVFSLLLSFVRLTRHLFFRVGVTGELSGTFSA